MNELTDNQINDALKVFACTVIGADRAIKDARWLEELRAYELTCSNLRAEIAGRGVPDGWRLVPVEPTPKMVDATWNHSVDSAGGIESQNARNRRIYHAMLAAAPQPPAQQGSKPDDETIEPTETCRTCRAPLGKMHMAAGNLKCGWPARVSTSDCDPLDDEKPPAQPERKPMTDEKKEELAGAWFAEDWAKKSAIGMLDDYEKFNGIKP